MKIGPLSLDNPVVLAPMAGYTDSPYRRICREYGAGVVYSEFVSSEGLVRDSAKTKAYLHFTDQERPIGIQIFGHDPAVMAAAAQQIATEYQPELIDINAGCAVRKVVKKQAGAALLREPERLLEIVRAVVKAVNLPVTVKLRSGWDPHDLLVPKIGPRLEDQGVKALTLHPRTAMDGFRSQPIYTHITGLKKAVTIPVIGNGDIETPYDAQQLFHQTGCDAVMIGRGALGNPWLFKRAIQLLAGSEIDAPATPLQKVALCKRHLQAENEYRGAETANKIMKKFYRWYFRGVPQAARIRNQLVQSGSITKTRTILNEIKKDWTTANEC